MADTAFPVFHRHILFAFVTRPVASQALRPANAATQDQPPS